MTNSNPEWARLLAQRDQAFKHCRDNMSDMTSLIYSRKSIAEQTIFSDKLLISIRNAVMWVVLMAIMDGPPEHDGLKDEKMKAMLAEAWEEIKPYTPMLLKLLTYGPSESIDNRDEELKLIVKCMELACAEVMMSAAFE